MGPGGPPCNWVKTKMLSFRCPVMMVTKSLDNVGKKWISGIFTLHPYNPHFLGQKWAVAPPPRSLPSNMSNTKKLSFWCLVMMVTKKLEDVHKRLKSGQKTALLGPKRATLGNRGRETVRRAAKQPPTGKPKVSRVTSRYGGLMIPLCRIRLTPTNGGYMGVA